MTKEHFFNNCRFNVYNWYEEKINESQERTGHLFQNRYMSEPVETESYLLTV